MTLKLDFNLKNADFTAVRPKFLFKEVAKRSASVAGVVEMVKVLPSWKDSVCIKMMEFSEFQAMLPQREIIRLHDSVRNCCILRRSKLRFIERSTFVLGRIRHGSKEAQASFVLIFCGFGYSCS